MFLFLSVHKSVGLSYAFISWCRQANKIQDNIFGLESFIVHRGPDVDMLKLIHNISQIMCRCTTPLETAVKEKISMFCHVEPTQVKY